MANILGNQPKVDIKQSTEIKCSECGGTIFVPGMMFRRISKLLTGSNKDSIIPVEVFLCGGCGEICEDLLPDEVKVLKPKADGGNTI